VKTICFNCEEEFPEQWTVVECPMCESNIIMSLEDYDELIRKECERKVKHEHIGS